MREIRCGSGPNTYEIFVKDCAQLQGASLRNAQLQGASLVRPQLQAANLTGANLQGAVLLSAKLRGADLSSAKLQGATLDSVEAQAAKFADAYLQSALLGNAQLQGAILDGANLQGTVLDGADLSGASLAGARFQNTSLINTFVWRANALTADGKKTVLADRLEFSPDKRCLDYDTQTDQCKVNLAGQLSKRFDELRGTIQSDMADEKLRQEALTRIDKLNPATQLQEENAISADWERMRNDALTQTKYAEGLAGIIVTLGCSTEGAPYVLRAFIKQFETFVSKSIEAYKLADAFLAESCFGSQGLSETEKLKLREIRLRGPAG